MPTLPTITVTQAQLDRITAAFPGDTLAKKAANYQAWTVGNLIDFVQTAEIRVIDEETNATKAAAVAAVAASLPARPAYPAA